jgi:hypothetical protein
MGSYRRNDVLILGIQGEMFGDSAEAVRSDPMHLGQVSEGLEGTVAPPIVNDSTGKPFTDSRDSLEILGPGSVDVERQVQSEETFAGYGNRDIG